MNTTNTLVSIIVPAYNVDGYIRKSLDSLCRQTYSNIEIIVVDDGSTDRTGIICDEFAAKDARVKVIHNVKTSVGEARNIGLDHATGELIGFVDADDWTDPCMFETLINTLVDNDVDVSICSYYRVKRKGTKPQRNDGRVYRMNSKQALCELIKDKTYKNYLWNKLFKRELFDGIRFPENTHYEDVAVVYRLFAKAHTFMCINKPLYYHVYRTGSIVHPKFYDAESCLQMFVVLVERSRFLQSYDRDVWKLTLNTNVHKGVQLIERSFLDASSSECNSRIVEICQSGLAAICPSYLLPYLRLQRWMLVNHLPTYKRMYLWFRTVFKSKVKYRHTQITRQRPVMFIPVPRWIYGR